MAEFIDLEVYSPVGPIPVFLKILDEHGDPVSIGQEILHEGISRVRIQAEEIQNL